MSEAVVLRPGEMRLEDWRNIAEGAPFRVDAAARAPV
jgi:hypothetical protein